MSTIAAWFSKACLIIGLVAVGLGAAAPALVYAQGPSDTATPPAPTTERLERVWAREQKIYARLGTFFEKADERIAHAQELIDRARANGKDVTALQAALDAFAAAVKDAKPKFESGKGIIASHQGFDANGKVVDAAKAAETVRDMHSKLREIRQTVLPAARELRKAVRDFRQANHPVATSTP